MILVTDRTSANSIDIAAFLHSMGLRHGYAMSYVTSAIVGPGYDEVRRETGLIRAEYLLLLCLSFEPVLTAQDIARMTRRPRNSISRAVHRMLDEGYIDRAPDPDDGRQSQLTITDKGRQMQQRIEQILLQRESEVIGVLTDAEHASLEGILRKLTRHATELPR